MFNPEKLLGGLISDSLGGKKSSSGLGMGILGVAVAAAEHFLSSDKAGSPSGQAPTNTGAVAPPPLPGTQNSNTGIVQPPPPVPPSQSAPPVPPTPPPLPKDMPQKSASDSAQLAVLLIRAMIASANSDGNIDAEEKEAIFKKLETLDLSQEERDFINQELQAPADRKTIVSQVKNNEQAVQVYAASLLAITVDTEEEIKYLEDLAEDLGLSAEQLKEIHQNFDVAL